MPSLSTPKTGFLGEMPCEMWAIRMYVICRIATPALHLWFGLLPFELPLGLLDSDGFVASGSRCFCGRCGRCFCLDSCWLRTFSGGLSLFLKFFLQSLRCIFGLSFVWVRIGMSPACLSRFCLFLRFSLRLLFFPPSPPLRRGLFCDGG